jgi:enoyl-CoA hydratase/carnithine racemase
MSVFDEYSQRYAAAGMERDEDGVLLVRLHTNGGPLLFGSDHADAHQLADAFIDIANDPDNRIVILTGTGESFCEGAATGLAAAAAEPMTWDFMYRNRRRLLLNLMEIEAPIISAINGPALFHAEVPLLGDIILAAETTTFMDGHAINGAVPGDGAHVIWPYLLGPVRAKYFLQMGQRIGADEALRIGFVNEVLPLDELLPRAWEIARMFAGRPTLSLRYTRAVINFELRRLLQEHLSHGLAVEGLAGIQLQGWRVPDGGSPPSWPTPAHLAESPLRPRFRWET